MSQYFGPRVNADGSVDIYFSDKMPEGRDKNWIRTIPNRGWFPMFRFYGQLEALYDKSWKLNDIEPV